MAVFLSIIVSLPSKNPSLKEIKEEVLKHLPIDPRETLGFEIQEHGLTFAGEAQSEADAESRVREGHKYWKGCPKAVIRLGSRWYVGGYHRD